MKRKMVMVGLLLCLLVTVTSPALVHAQSTITAQSSAQVDFPSRLTFSISAKSDVTVTEIRLRYTVNRESFAQSFSEAFVVFTPATTVKASWALDMRKTGGLPTGTSLTYWWIIKDEGGNKMETTPQQVEFNDNRYQWRNISEGRLTIYWYKGDDAFANQLMTTAQEALLRLGKDTGASVIRPIRIYIYADTQAVQGATIFPSEWTGGIAFTEYAIIAIGIAPNDLEWGKRAVSHELTHLVIHQMTFNPYSDLPTWLDEGLAVYNEGPPEPQFISLLDRAIASNKTISVRSLTSPFSANSNQAILSYAESHSIVNYLITTYGQPKMLELLTTLQRGSTYDNALSKVYGFDMDQLYVVWKQEVAPKKTSVREPLTISFLTRLIPPGKDLALGMR